MTSPLHIDQTQAASLFALVLLEEEELDRANKLTDQICRRLSYAMFAAGIKTSTDRIIPRSPSGMPFRLIAGEAFTPAIGSERKRCAIAGQRWHCARPPFADL